MALRPKIAVIASYLVVLCIVVFTGSTTCCGPASRRGADESKARASGSGPKIRPLTDVTFERTAARLERGEYLAEGVLQCFVCHTERDWTKPGAPPVASKKGAGKVWEGKSWLVASNITPDKETGSGTWTDDMLARAIREGISHHGRVLDSHMWSASFRGLSDEDLASVIVYLRSIPPIYNSLPQTRLEKEIDPPTPLTEGVPEPDLSTPLKRGKYLVRIGTCMACHTAFDAPVNPGFFGGGDLVERGEQRAFSANLTSDPSGISYYDEALFIQTLRTGQVKARKLKPLMPWIAVRTMNDEDWKAIFAYLRTRAPVQHVVDNTERPTFCAMCGQTHGFGDRNHTKEIHSVAVDPKTLDAYTGQYRFDVDDFVFTIYREADLLRIQNGIDGPVYELVAISENEFTAREMAEIISFARDDQGRVTHLVSNLEEIAKKIK